MKGFQFQWFLLPEFSCVYQGADFCYENRGTECTNLVGGFMCEKCLEGFEPVGNTTKETNCTGTETNFIIERNM